MPKVFLETESLMKPYRNNEDSFVDNLMLGVQLADVSTRCSSHPQGKSEARCEIDGRPHLPVSPWGGGPSPW